tara:strand:+ start:3892 stop:5967 length:2076 start_codon:yes stop_codon:yes gene_type:complete
MNLNSKINHSKNIFWILVLSIWLISTFIDRVWWNFFSNTPSWDQADYLNSALDHARALSLLDGNGFVGFKSLLDLSPKIPPLASIINAFVIALVGDSPHLASWSLSIWNGFLIFNIASWGLYLNGRRFGFLCVLITAISPFLFQLRTDYVLELPLISMTTFYLFHLGRWSDPIKGGKWIQVIISTIGCVGSLLIKQSALLVIIPSFVFIFILCFNRSIAFRLQFFFLSFISFIGVLPWFYHNWIMTLSGTYRAVFESAALEGDPSIFGIKSILWYFPFLNLQFGSIIFYVGISGILFGCLSYFRSLNQTRILFHECNYKWRWIYFNLLTSWTFTTFIPNKDVRYIACTIPLITLCLALGFCRWNDWIDSYFKFKFHRTLIFFPIALSFIPFSNFFNKLKTSERRYYPIKEIISEVQLNVSNEKDTVVIVPSTPDLNQHNVSYLGRMQGGNILGRQLGKSLSHQKPVLEKANWIVLADGEQGSVPSNSLALDKAIRESGLFTKTRQFPRQIGGSYSLWKRNSDAPKPEKFENRFVKLARGMENGPLGIKLIFDEIAIHHMIDGHFKYQIPVRDEALSKISSNPKDIDALWTLTLLEILSNRPSKADIYLESLEDLLPQNPWPSAYRSIMNLATWNPWKASKIADNAYIKHRNYVLKALGDTGAVLGGSIWRLPSTFKSIPNAINNIEQLSNS